MIGQQLFFRLNYSFVDSNSNKWIIVYLIFEVLSTQILLNQLNFLLDQLKLNREHAICEQRV